MKVSVAIALLVLLAAGPISCQRLPRTRSRLSAAEAEAAAAEKAEALKRVKSKMTVEAATNTSSTSPSSDASPPSPSPSPPPPTTLSSKPSAAPSSNTTSNKTSSTSTTTPEPTSTSSVPPPVSSVQVRMSFAPSKKAPEERVPKSAPKEEDPKNKKPSDTQETTKEPSKKPASTSTSSPTTTSTAKPPPKSPSTKKPDQDEELRDVLKRIHQEVLKQPRYQEAKNKSTTSTTTKKPPKEEKGLETAESVYVRPPVIQQRVHDTDAAPLDAQASIQSTKFVLRDQGLQVLPSFVRSKDRSRPIPPGTVRHILVQKQPPLSKQALVAPQRQRSDPIDEEAIGSTTSTTAFPHIAIVHFDKEQSADGSYKTSYETANNIFAEETGFLKNPGVEDQEALVQQGSYSYTAPDGSLISVTYTADEQGFRATGTHLPTPPPVSPEIQRSLDIIYAQIQRDEEEAAREAELERQGEASETHEEKLSPPTTGSKRESRRYLPRTDDHDQ